jgi:hypothetical protein
MREHDDLTVMLAHAGIQELYEQLQSALVCNPALGSG